jgi:anti-sigma B factor antagonist
MNGPLDVAVQDGSPTVITLSGELDLATVGILREAFSSVDGSDLIVDCTGLQFLDSTGIAVFVSARHEREQAGRTLALRNVSGIPRRALEVCGLLDALEGGDGEGTRSGSGAGLSDEGIG